MGRVSILGNVCGADGSTWLRAVDTAQEVDGHRLEVLVASVRGGWKATDQGRVFTLLDHHGGADLRGLIADATLHHATLDPAGRLTLTAPTLTQAVVFLTRAARDMTGTRLIRLTSDAIETIIQALTEMHDNWRACRAFDPDYQDAVDALTEIRKQTGRERKRP